MESSSSLSWATVDPNQLSGEQPGRAFNLVKGEWKETQNYQKLPDPLNGQVFLLVPDTQTEQMASFIESLSSCPKSGLHNPFKNTERYLLYGKIMRRAAELLHKPEVFTFFSRLIQRVMPKSKGQAQGEMLITRNFVQNFAGDNVRFLARSFGYPGDHTGQSTTGYRWPYGPVAIISPFNYPIEIPFLQLMGALFMGNKPLLKVDSRVSICMEQVIRMLHVCGLPKEDVDFLHSSGPNMQYLLQNAPLRMTQFTGSSFIAQKLASVLKGKIKIEDAGFDWKITGPDVTDVDFVAYTCDQDAYALSGQKCSAQSILFVHQNWKDSGLIEKMKIQAARRNLADLTVGPVLSWTTEKMLAHMNSILKLEGAQLLFGGKPLDSEKIPKCYGAIEPTAILVPIDHLQNKDYFELLTTECFGPFQIVCQYRDSDLEKVLDIFEAMSHHLTAAIVSNDIRFQNKVLSRTINGTQYVGIRARTTGAPQNHWFGPAGDPRGAGIGSPQAIKLVWSCHREIIMDVGPSPKWDDLPLPS